MDYSDKAHPTGGNGSAWPEHPLRARLDLERRNSGRSMTQLSVLSDRRDPYRLDTPALRRDGAWLAREIARLAVRLAIHLRGVHYAIVAVGDAVKPDGLPYENTAEDWQWLSEVAAKAARWLGYIPFDAIVDERNEPPVVFVPESIEPRPVVYCSFRYQLPNPQDIQPRAALVDFAPQQPYRIVLAGEKTSLRPVLEPIARRYKTELVLPTGEMSDTLIKGIADRAMADGRPCVVLYFADFDPSGWQMPISVARKLQALGDLMPGLPPMEVHRVGLLDTHVKVYGLPSTPLKPEELRADGWRKRWGGLQQTEIDALAALRPTVLAQIAKQAVAPFYDATLYSRAHAAHMAWLEDAREVLVQSIDHDWLEKARLELQARLEELGPELERIQRSIEIDPNSVDLPPTPVVGPDLHGLPSSPAPLWSSADDWTEATLRLAADRTLVGRGPVR